VRETELDELDGRLLRCTAEAAVHRGCRHLDESAHLDQRPEALGGGLNVGVPLGVGEDGRDAQRLQMEDPLRKLERPAVVGELEEHVVGVAAEPEPAKLRLGQKLEPVDRHLAALAQVERDPLLDERPPEITDERLHRLRLGRIVVADMRRRRENLDTVLDGRASDVEAVLERPRAVVDAREDVRVEVDHAQRTLVDGGSTIDG
jgi:hypothetical protein